MQIYGQSINTTASAGKDNNVTLNSWKDQQQPIDEPPCNEQSLEHQNPLEKINPQSKLTRLQSSNS